MIKTLSERDRALLWHPFTQEKTADMPVGIQRGKGAYVYDTAGKAYLDLISSWWVNLHGHAHPEIARAIYEQALQLEHIIFSGYTHEPAVLFCERLSKVLPSTLVRFFYSDNGSTAVEVALKMAYQYWRNQGEKNRTYFLSFEGGYHGDTFGAMAVGAKSGFHDAYEALFFKVLHLPFSATWLDDGNIEEKEVVALAALEVYLEQYGQQIAALIVEPLVQGASGMRMCRVEFLRKVIARVRQYNILVIYDEIMTGFGRTGKHFAMDHVNIAPDLLCVSKGITGGFLPLALTVATASIYEAFLDDDWKKSFVHGHSYTANPLACAAANASLTLLLAEQTQQAIQHIQRCYEAALPALLAQTKVSCVRTMGTILAFDMPTNEHAKVLQAKCLSQGLILRPLGKTVYFLPPYAITAEALTQALNSVFFITFSSKV